jgi:DNA-binding transcriptional LysR family regulator
MNIRLLEYFIIMAETRQITVAAQKLHMAQPPLSRNLQKLEDELGVILFNRTNKGIELTNSGKALYEKAKELLGNYKEMVDMVKETEKGICGMIRIGTIFSTIPLFTDKISYIRKHYPLIEFQIIQDSHAELMEKLKNGLLDVMFFSMPSIGQNDFSFMTLDADPLVLVVNKDMDPAPKQDFVTIDHLKDVPLCMMQTGDFYGYNEILIAECKKHGFSPNIICQCNSTSAVITLVAKGIGLSYQPKIVVDTSKNPYIYSKSIKDFEIKIHPAILWNKNAHLSGGVKMFLSLFDYNSIVSGSEFEHGANLAGLNTGDHK